MQSPPRGPRDGGWPHSPKDELSLICTSALGEEGSSRRISRGPVPAAPSASSTSWLASLPGPGFQEPSLGFEFSGQRLLIGKGRSVLGGQDLVGKVFQGVMGDGRILLGAEDDADGWIFAPVGPVFPGVVQ